MALHEELQAVRAAAIRKRRTQCGQQMFGHRPIDRQSDQDMRGRRGGRRGGLMADAEMLIPHASGHHDAPRRISAVGQRGVRGLPRCQHHVRQRRMLRFITAQKEREVIGAECRMLDAGTLDVALAGREHQ